LYAHESISEVFEKRGATCIANYFFIGRMSGAINFNDQQGFATDDIGDVTANRHLANKLEPSDLPITQFGPKS